MGQQQLLLLVLGVVIVGLAVVVGIQAFGENQTKANADAMVNDGVRIASDAQAWKLKPQAFGGGGALVGHEARDGVLEAHDGVAQLGLGGVVDGGEQAVLLQQADRDLHLLLQRQRRRSSVFNTQTADCGKLSAAPVAPPA